MQQENFFPISYAQSRLNELLFKAGPLSQQNLSTLRSTMLNTSFDQFYSHLQSSFHYPIMMDGRFIKEPQQPETDIHHLLTSGMNREITDDYQQRSLSLGKGWEVLTMSSLLHIKTRIMINKMRISDVFYDDLKVHDNHRFGRYYMNTLEGISKGFAGKQRATGEEAVDHSIRVWNRFASQNSPVSLNLQSTGGIIPMPNYRLKYISNLAAFLHDVKEDCPGFTMKKNSSKKNNTRAAGYEITFHNVCQNNQEKPIHIFYHDMDDDEALLLQLQIDALTSLDDNGNGLNSEEQFSKLIGVTGQIEEQFGPLAALFTLEIKDADRYDNVSTYFPRVCKNGERKSKFAEKIIETCRYFKIIHHHKQRLLDSLYRNSDETTQTRIRNYRPDSALRLGCYFLLGGSYDIFDGLMDYYSENDNSDDYQSAVDLVTRSDLLIPQLPPYSHNIEAKITQE